MKYVFISKVGDILPIAQRIEDEGNEVSLYICQDESQIVEKHITEFGPDIIVIDSWGFGILASRLRKQGFKVIGGSQLTDKLEEDSTYEKRVLKMFGLNTDGGTATAVVVDGFFNGKNFVAVSYTAEGVSWMGEREDRLFKAGLEKLAPVIAKAEYSGVVSLTANISKEGVFFNNLKAKFTSSSMLLMREGLKGRLSNLLYTLAYTQNRVFMFKPGWFIYVPIVVYKDDILVNNGHYDVENIEIKQEITKHLWLYGFSKKTVDKFAYHGKGGRVAVVTARGDTIREARRRVYRTAFGIGIPNAMFSKTIGNSASGIYNKVKEEKWI